MAPANLEGDASPGADVCVADGGLQYGQYSELEITSSVRGPHDGQVADPLSPTDFRAICANRGGACSVQMGQENVIALLLKQQEEMIKELRVQKKVPLELIAACVLHACGLFGYG